MAVALALLVLAPVGARAVVLVDETTTAFDGFGVNTNSGFQQVAAIFSLTADSSITNITWFGFNQTGAPVQQTDFDLQVFADDGANLPLTAPLVSFAATGVGSVATGLTNDNPGATRDVFEFSYDLATPLDLAAGTYWLGVRSAVTTPTYTWALKQNNVPGGGFGAVRFANLDAWSAFPGRMSFSISGTTAVPEPATVMLAGLGLAALGWGTSRSRRTNTR